jgi:chemotaxis response regulator CheB
VKVAQVNPNEEIQHLKFRIKNVPELGLQTFLLNDFSLKNQQGKTLEPTKKIYEEVQPDEIVYVVSHSYVTFSNKKVLSTPESVIGDFAQFQDMEEPIIVDLKNPELHVFDALPESLKTPITRTKSTDEPRYIVAIGTSAGGLESLQKFFDNIECDTGKEDLLL